MNNQPTIYLLSLLKGTTAGRFASVGALLQVLSFCFLAAKAYQSFPDDVSTTLLGLALMHLCTAFAVLGAWLWYGVFLRRDSGKLLLVLLVFLSAAPFFPTLDALRG